MVCVRSGAPTFFRTYTPDGRGPVFQGTVGPKAKKPEHDPDLIVSAPLEAGGAFELAGLFYERERYGRAESDSTPRGAAP